jgi:hypothetical protein
LTTIKGEVYLGETYHETFHKKGDTVSVDSDLLHKKIMGCWLGKAVGGTLGQNFEGLIGPLDAQFYTPVPTEMIPNDDLDLQVLYAVLLSESADPSVDRIFLGSAWEGHVEFPWNEFGKYSYE